MKVGDKVIVVNKVYDEYLNGITGVIVGEHISNSHYRMLAPSQMWVVSFEGIGNATFYESDLELV